MEICGLIDIKVPSKGRKFGSWKTWKNQWCEVLKNENRMIINIGPSKGNVTSCLAVSNNAIIYRIKSRTKAYGFGIFYAGEKEQQPCIFLAGKSETESQKWMKSMRDVLKTPMYPKATNEYAVSIIDNEHSKTAGLTGLYGTLSVKTEEILVTDPHTGKIKVTLHWTQIQCSYLPLPAVCEDLHKVCTLRTNSKFKAGDGDLELFCTEADELHNALLSCPRPLPRIATTPLPPTPKEKQNPSNSNWSDSPSMTPPRCLLESRRMSRSEGDLKKFVLQQPPLLRSAGSQQHLILLPQNNLMQRSSSHFLLTSMGLLQLTTPGYSEPNSMQDLRLIDQHLLAKRLQGLAEDEERTSLEEKSEDEEYDEILRMDAVEQANEDNDTPPPLPPRQLKYVTMANLGGNNKLYISGPVPI